MTKIFVSICCFSDQDILNTIEHCFQQALKPSQIILGICLQYDLKDTFFKKYKNHPQIRLIQIDWRKAKGPTYARYLITNLIQDEDFYFQIDCHTRFFKHWDAKCIYQWFITQDPKAILTNFPIPISKMDAHENYPLNKSPSQFFELSKDIIKLGSIQCHTKDKKHSTYNLSAACLFGKTSFIKDVPYDPYLIFCYQKIEQQFYAIRLFTHGYNLYMPQEHLIATQYEKSKHYDSHHSPIFVPNNKNEQDNSWKRVCYFYGIINKDDLPTSYQNNLDLYCLGNIRSLEDFFNIHHQENVIQKIKQGFTFKNNKWSYKSNNNYNCTNIFLKKIIQDHNYFKLNSSSDNLCFNWNMDVKNTSSTLQHYLKKNVSFIDHKKRLYELFYDSHITNGIPITYFNTEHLIDGQNYFLKYAHHNGGNHVFIYNQIDEIKKHISHDPNKAFIIQEEIKQPLLIDHKKCVLRIWLVLIDNSFYLSSNGVIVIHEKKYEPNILNKNIHISHDPHKVCFESFKSFDFYSSAFQHLQHILTPICNLFLKKIELKANCFQVFGLDIIYNTKYEPFLIEINSWPNMIMYQEKYKKLLNEFFYHFYHDLIIHQINKKEIQSNYFTKII